MVTKSPDGKIWFSAPDGVSVIDPRHLPFNKLPPPVHIEQITADGKSYDSSHGLRLPPRIRDLTIRYTALSLVAPEKVHFRFKLEGQDEDWREVVNQREVEYSNLAAGQLPLPRHRLATTAACGTRKARFWISPLRRRTTRRTGSARCACSRFWRCSGPLISCVFTRYIASSLSDL